MNGTNLRSGSIRSDASLAAVTIGLVNNMPASASAATERQFRRLLAEAADDQNVVLRCYRTGARDAAAAGFDMDAIFDSELDGLIVTGAEPQAVDLRDEPIWPLITRLVDWAETRKLPTLLSCLAAHAAVLHLDGVDRIRRDRKISGLFKGEVVAPDHPLMTALAGEWTVPHSRYNDLPEEALTAGGYRILVRSSGAGVDLFQRVRDPNFVFLQSHPEYDADTLRREFYRDVKRYQTGARSEPPVLPSSYFPAIAGSLSMPPPEWPCVSRENVNEFLDWLSCSGDRDMQAPWRTTAVTFFRNWLRDLSAKTMMGDALARVPQHDRSHAGRLKLGLVPW